MFNEKKSVESFNAFQCVRSYLNDLSLKELKNLARDYDIKVESSLRPSN